MTLVIYKGASNAESKYDLVRIYTICAAQRRRRSVSTDDKD